MANPAYTPPTAVTPYREKEPPRMPPCPWCGGTVVLALIRRELQVYCSECPWNPDDGSAPEVNQ